MKLRFIKALPRFRVLPMLMVSCGFMLCVKAYDIVQGGNALSSMLVADAAAVPAEEGAKKEQEAEGQAPEEGAEAAVEGEGEAPTPEEPEYQNGQIISAEEAKQDIFSTDARKYSETEVLLLQRLAQRREELNEWEESIQTKENLLAATESRIEKKIAEMTALKDQVQAVLDEYQKHEDKNIKSLVKIYESMKPADAARIFDELESPVLLKVMNKMSERKAAPIIAKMNPLKARHLTVRLSEFQKVKDVASSTLKK